MPPDKPIGKQSILLASNALVNQGGMGLNLRHMLDALQEHIAHVVSQSKVSDFSSLAAPKSKLSHYLMKTPYLRRRVDWEKNLDANRFDSFVLEVLKELPSEIFFATSGDCFRSLESASKEGRRVVLDIVNSHIEEYHESIKRECDRFGTYSFLSDSLRKKTIEGYSIADSMRVMSHFAKNTLVDRGVPAEKVFVASPHLSIQEFKLNSRKPKNFRISFAGLIVPWKGFHYLIDAFKQLKDKDSELVFWGNTGARSIKNYFDEEMKKDPRIMIKNVSIRETGYDKTYGSSHVLVHPAVSDGFAYVVAEAMASGVPVIVTEKTGASDWVVEGENGFIVPARDSNAICERLDYLKNNPDRVKQMGDNARKTAERYTVSSFRSQLEAGIFKSQQSLRNVS